MKAKRREQDLIEKIRRLPEDKLAEDEDFVDFLREPQEDASSRRGWLALRRPHSRRSGTTRTMPSMTAFAYGDVRAYLIQKRSQTSFPLIPSIRSPVEDPR